MAARRHRAGFTLIEIMVAVGVLALTAAIALPHYHSSLFRAQRVEAVMALEAVNTAQFAYFGAHDEFAPDFQRLDFRSEGALQSPRVFKGKRYTYTLSMPYGAKSWVCSASADLDGDPWPDLLVAYERL